MVKSVVIDSGLGFADFNITLLDALKMARATWDTVTPVTVANCFLKEALYLNLNLQVNWKKLKRTGKMCHLLLYVCMSHVHVTGLMQLFRIYKHIYYAVPVMQIDLIES